MNRVIVLVVVLILLTALIFWVSGGSLGALGSGQGAASMTANIVMVVLLVSSLVLSWRGSASEAVRYFFIWLAVGFALVLAYSFRNDLRPMWDRVAGEVNPALPQERGGEVVLRKARDGHFYADVGVNGRSIRMLADTGASTIALSAEDARTAGIDVDELKFMYVISTANGEAVAAQIDLDEVRVGSIVRRNIRAMVTRNMSGSLLGMSFFSSLSKTAIQGDELVLQD